MLRGLDDESLPEREPGQFVEVRVEGGESTFLRCAISSNCVDREANELWLLVAAIEDGTRHIVSIKQEDTLNCERTLG